MARKKKNPATGTAEGFPGGELPDYMQPYGQTAAYGGYAADVGETQAGTYENAAQAQNDSYGTGYAYPPEGTAPAWDGSPYSIAGDHTYNPDAANRYASPAGGDYGYAYPAGSDNGYAFGSGNAYANGVSYPYPVEGAEAENADIEAEGPTDAPRRKFAFKVRNLTKDYDGHTVLNNISFDIPAGKIVGLLGPNGCGKTTLIKILTGLIKDYTGVVKVGGRSIGIASKAHLAYLPDTTYFPGRFRTIDCIKYYDDFFDDFDRIKATQFASDFGLDLNQRVKTMSKGMQEKLQLLVVMSRRADIYVLDEPLGGVDPAARGVILDIIMNNYKENATVLLSTHLVNDLEHSFDHVLMLGKGAVLVNTGIDTLRATGKTVEEIFKEVIGDAWEVD